MQLRKHRLCGILALAAFIACIFSAPCALHSQVSTTASLSGTVVDPTGAVIPNAAVTLKNVATGDVTQTKSNGAGDFTFAAVPVGNYEVDVAAPGFKVLRSSGVHLDPGNQVNLHELKLTPGAATQIVRVRVANQSIPLDTGESSTLISAADINRLTVEGRDVTELVKILPGFAMSGGNNNITNSGYDPSQVTVTGAYGSYSGEGTITNSVALLYNGIDVTDPGAYASMLQNINYDQVSEVKVTTSSMTADQAHGPVVINVAGTSGTSQFHGSVYTYGRTSQFNSSDWLSKFDNQPKPPDREVYPGFTLSGPILIPHTNFNHNRRLMFFAGAEDYAQRNEYAYGNAGSAILTALVPTAGMRTGDFSQAQISQYLGPLESSLTYQNISQVPVTGKDGSALVNGQLGANVDPVNQELLNTLPLPNLSQTSPGGYNYATTNLVDNDLWQAQGRIDYSITDRNKVFVMYSTERGKAGIPQVEYYSPRGPMGGTNTPGGGMLSDLNTEMGTLNWTSIISPTLTNQFSVSGVWFNQPFVAKDFNALTLNGAWTNTGLFNNGSKVIPQFGDYGDDGLPVNLYPDTTFGGIYAKKWTRGGEDNVTKVFGKHTVRAGFYGQLITNHQVTPFVASNGSLDLYYFGETSNDPVVGTIHNTGVVGSGNGGNYLANFLEGGIFGYTQTNISPAPNLFFWDLAGYVQDHYRLTPYLSIDYGVRFDHLTPWSDAHGLGVPVWEPSTYSTGQNPALPGFLWHGIDKSIPASGLATRWAFVEPRVGFALDVFRNGNTVIRGGFGVYTAHDSSNDLETPASTAMGERTVSWCCDALLSSMPAVGPSTIGGNPFVPTQDGYGFFPNDDNQPQVYTWNLAVDQKAFYHSLVQIAYLGNVSRHLLNNGSTQPVTLDNINAIPVGSLYKPDPITGVTYPLAPPANSGIVAVGGMSQQEVDDFRPFPLYDSLDVGTHNVNANYNSLQLIWNKQQGPLFFGINYTWSKALGVLGAGNNGTPVTPFDYIDDYGPEAFDRTQVFNASYSYTMGKVLHERFLGGVVNQWMISGITTVQSGQNLYAANNPDFSMTGQLDVQATDGTPTTLSVSSQNLLGTPDVYLMPQISCNPALAEGSHHYVNSSCFALLNQIGVNGPYREPYMRGPANTDSDLAVQKAFGLGEGRNILVRYSAFNFLNHANTTFSSSVNPNAIQLNFTNAASGTQAVSQALASASNSNASVFGYAPLRIGRRVTELEVKFNF
ncbi:MAG: carboxypeptidase-like regulatory domain-containing protein [Acidobacteriaceae bacterium]